MKSYFIRLFDYDTFANKLLLDSIRLSGNPEKPVKLMAHLLAARQIWLHRCTGRADYRNCLMAGLAGGNLFNADRRKSPGVAVLSQPHCGGRP